MTRTGRVCSFQPAAGSPWICARCAQDEADPSHQSGRVPSAADFPDCAACQKWEDAGASWPRPCAKHYGGEPGRTLSWQVTSEGHPVREFTDQQEAEDYAASWNAAYPPSEGYTEFVVEARHA